MPRHLEICVLGTVLTLVQVGVSTAASSIEVVATILPVHSLASSVMAGVAEPTLLVKGGASPHSFQLRPSDARSLVRAKVIFWVGPEIESLLDKPLRSVPKNTTIVELLDIEGLRVLKPREGGVWGTHDHEHGPQHVTKTNGDVHEDEDRDGHVWLDPLNAMVMVGAMVRELSDADPSNAERYRKNGTELAVRLEELDGELASKLREIKDRPFIVLHDAYQYLETRYDLKAAGAITVTPDRKPSAKRLSDLRRTIRERGAVCVFDEPQVRTGLVATLVQGTAARAGTLDPEGASTLEPGLGAYFDLMRRNADALITCLGGAAPS